MMPCILSRTIVVLVACGWATCPVPDARGAGPDRPTTEPALGTTRPLDGKNPLALTPLPLGEIKPAGWLKAQLKLQADGLGGQLDDFWPDIKDSAWFGGKAEGWERVPYWLDGLVPIAYQLDDPKLKAKVKKAVDTILARQQPDGWLGPIGDNNPKHKPYDVWPLFPLFKAFVQYQEASADPRIVPAMLKCCKKIDQVITKEPIYSWAHFRAADFAVSLYWLHDKTSDPLPFVLARKALAQAYDWRKHFENFEKYREKATKFGLDNHGVNNGMALKFGGVRWRLSGDDDDRDLITLMLAQLDRYHGQATGIFTCDEHYAGRSPSQGTELCTVAEAMYSLEVLLSITGKPELGDRLEKLAFNAWPATFKKDMTAHQYDQQTNQVVCKISQDRVYTNNGPDANIYGLEPNFGCCTANFHQGWPKFVEHLWMKTPDEGLAMVAYAPCVVETTIREKPVRIEVITDYPFVENVKLVIRCENGARFPIYLRIPGWCSSVYMTSEPPPARELTPNTPAARFTMLEADWYNGATIELGFGAAPRLIDGFNGSVAIQAGPLVYALKIDAEWKKIKGMEPFADWEVLPKSPWNYALQIDREHPGNSIVFEHRRVGERPFSQAGAPILAKVKGRLLPDWKIEKNAAAPPPKSPVSSDQPLVDLMLVPYGCTDLRVTEFPTLK